MVELLRVVCMVLLICALPVMTRPGARLSVWRLQ